MGSPSGRILGAGETRIRSAHIGNSGQIDGGRLDIAAPVLDNSGRISQSGSRDLTVDTARLANSGRIGLPENNNGNSGNSSGNNGGNNGNSGGNNGNSGGGNGNSGNKRPPANNGNGNNGNNGNGGSTQVPAPADGRISVSGRLDNSGTIEAGGRTDLSVSSEMANSGHLTLGSLKADGSRFDNRQGDILARSADINSRHSEQPRRRPGSRQPETGRRHTGQPPRRYPQQQPKRHPPFRRSEQPTRRNHHCRQPETGRRRYCQQRRQHSGRPRSRTDGQPAGRQRHPGRRPRRRPQTQRRL